MIAFLVTFKPPQQHFIDPNRFVLGIMSNSKFNIPSPPAPAMKSFVQSFSESLSTYFTSLNITLSSSAFKGQSVIVDPFYIRDLQHAFAQKMVNRLLQEFHSIDQRVKVAEMRCARLMTLLRPAFQQAGALVPESLSLPPPAPPLSSYALTYPSGRESSIMEPRLQDCKLLLLRTRRLYRDLMQRPQGERGERGGEEAEAADQEIERLLEDVLRAHHLVEGEDCELEGGAELRFVLRRLFRHFARWMDEEFAARLARKVCAASERVGVVLAFKQRLVERLHARFTLAAVRDLDHPRVDPRDRAALVRMKAEFPFVDVFAEPPILECPALCRACPTPTPTPSPTPSSSSSSGTLFITTRHVLFVGVEGLEIGGRASLLHRVLPAAGVGNPDLRVVPLRSVAAVCCEGRVVDLSAVNAPVDSTSKALLGLTLSSPAALSPLELRLVNVQGRGEILLELRHTGIADLAGRVADLLQVIVQVPSLLPSLPPPSPSPLTLT